MTQDPYLPARNPMSGPPASVAPGWYPSAPGMQCYWDGHAWTGDVAPLAPTPQGYLATDARTNGVEVAVAWVLTVLTLGYMLPWAVAATRGKSNSVAVGLVNFLLGWTFVGWIVALVMACGAHQVVAVRR